MITITPDEAKISAAALRLMAARMTGGTFDWPSPLPRSQDLLSLAEQFEVCYLAYPSRAEAITGDPAE